MQSTDGQRSALAGAPLAAWPDDARRVLERAILRHGGARAWRSVAAVEFEGFTLGGAIPWAKGVGRTFPLPPAIRVEPGAERTVFREYPRAGVDGVYERGDVRLVERESGETLAASADHVTTFRGLAKHRRWSPLDALFFFGRALGDYQSLPFALTEARFVGTREARVGGERCDGLELELPPARRTHCRRQTFFFDESGLLRRHDYVAEVIGAFARGCHLWEGWETIAGVPVALRRRVVARALGRATPIVVLEAAFRAATIELLDETARKEH